MDDICESDSEAEDDAVPFAQRRRSPGPPAILMTAQATSQPQVPCTPPAVAQQLVVPKAPTAPGRDQGKERWPTPPSARRRLVVDDSFLGPHLFVHAPRPMRPAGASAEDFATLDQHGGPLRVLPKFPHMPVGAPAAQQQQPVMGAAPAGTCPPFAPGVHRLVGGARAAGCEAGNQLRGARPDMPPTPAQLHVEMEAALADAADAAGTNVGRDEGLRSAVRGQILAMLMSLGSQPAGTAHNI
jgi:hypothetical protein